MILKEMLKDLLLKLLELTKTEANVFNRFREIKQVQTTSFKKVKAGIRNL